MKLSDAALGSATMVMDNFDQHLAPAACPVAPLPSGATHAARRRFRRLRARHDAHSRDAYSRDTLLRLRPNPSTCGVTRLLSEHRALTTLDGILSELQALRIFQREICDRLQAVEMASAWCTPATSSSSPAASTTLRPDSQYIVVPVSVSPMEAAADFAKATTDCVLDYLHTPTEMAATVVNDSQAPLGIPGVTVSDNPVPSGCCDGEGLADLQTLEEAACSGSPRSIRDVRQVQGRPLDKNINLIGLSSWVSTDCSGCTTLPTLSTTLDAHKPCLPRLPLDTQTAETLSGCTLSCAVADLSPLKLKQYAFRRQASPQAALATLVLKRYVFKRKASAQDTPKGLACMYCTELIQPHLIIHRDGLRVCESCHSVLFDGPREVTVEASTSLPASSRCAHCEDICAEELLERRGGLPLCQDCVIRCDTGAPQATDEGDLCDGCGTWFADKSSDFWTLCMGECSRFLCTSCAHTDASGCLVSELRTDAYGSRICCLCSDSQHPCTAFSVASGPISGI
eukprot:TRINITY_DN40360_c0_g1_i1.p1 TRINITY_DN40360_c0_g1~~TRINITY_DN40360_c0_g1_i1.p1  ORF type:complete len:513 (-),score=35.32 TRINITY_DN40360_c0_g1_i1:83-1621(-)